MKKITIMVLTALSLLGCSRDYDYINAGLDGNTQYTGAYTRAYLQQIADNLVIQNLQALEAMIALYEDEIWTVGASFVYENNLSVRGVTITKDAADSTWTLSRSGTYPINGIDFPTDYTINARMAKGMGTANHYDWNLTINGERTEDKGYACTFSCNDPMQYKSSYSPYGMWTSIFGKIIMYVTKNGAQIDKAVLEFKGDPNTPFYANLN